MTTTERPLRILVRRHIFRKAKKVIALNLPVSPRKPKLSISQPHRTKVSYAAARRMMQQHGVLGFRWYPHAAPGAVLLKVHFIGGPQVHFVIILHRLEFFLCAFCRSGSAWARAGRGLRSRKPNLRNRRWHCRTPKAIPYCRLIQAANVFPSHTFPPKPISRGIRRRAALIPRRCFALRRPGRPDRSPSRKAARPRSSNPRIQYSTVLGASPNNAATSGQVLPWATSSRPCSRWS